jgi:probable HAF family extracellular repeat protein
MTVNERKPRKRTFDVVCPPANVLQLSQARIRPVKAMLIVLALLLFSTSWISAQMFKTINYPGAVMTHANGINAFGQIVGEWEDTSSRFHGFLYSGGTLTSLDYPGATVTNAMGINNAGQIVGLFSASSGNGAFLYSGGVYTRLAYADAFAINDLGSIVVGNGYVTSAGTFIGISDPSGASGDTDSFGINNLEQTVGYYETPQFTGPNGFLYFADSYTTIDFPGQSTTSCFGINNYGEIVGWYTTPTTLHGFTWTSGGTFTSFDYPGTASGTEPNAINDFGMIVGSYLTNNGSTYVYNGFLMIPSVRNPVPFINEPLVPETLPPGSSQFTLKVNGTGFMEGALVYWNGSPRQTSFQSGEQLTATIYASDVATAGTASVTVANPSPGGGRSNVQFFQVTTPVPNITASQS